MRIDQADDAILTATALRMMQAVGPFLLGLSLDDPAVNAIPDEIHQQVDEVVERLVPELVRVARRTYPESQKEGEMDRIPMVALSNALYAGAEVMSHILLAMAQDATIVLAMADRESTDETVPHPGYL